MAEFEPSTPAGSDRLRNLQDIPRPFVFRPTTEIKYQGVTAEVTAESPYFHHLIKRLRDRINAIAWFYAGTLLEIDYAEFGSRAESVRTLESYFRWTNRERLSTRTRQRHSIGGFVGRVTYAGKIDDYVPLLRLGEFLHVTIFARHDTSGAVKINAAATGNFCTSQFLHVTTPLANSRFFIGFAIHVSIDFRKTAKLFPNAVGLRIVSLTHLVLIGPKGCCVCILHSQHISELLQQTDFKTTVSPHSVLADVQKFAFTSDLLLS